MTNEELVRALERSAERYWCGKEGDLDRLYDEMKAPRAAVLARMVTGEDAQRAAFMAGCKWEREMAITPSDAAP